MYRLIKKLSKILGEKFSKKQLYTVLVFLIGTGLMVAVLSISDEEGNDTISEVTFATPSEIATDSKLETETDTEAATSETEKEYVASIDELNLAYYYPEGADKEDQLNSYAGEVYKELMKKDNDYLARIFDNSGMSPQNLARKLGVSSARVMGKYNPKESSHDPDDPGTWYIPVFKNVNVAFYNADGKRINECSNVKDIMAMASVYCYSHDSLDPEAFKAYCEELYGKSRSYSVSIGNVYYDDGCINRSAKEEAEELKKTEKALTFLKQYLASTRALPVEADAAKGLYGGAFGITESVANESNAGLSRESSGSLYDFSMGGTETTAATYGNSDASAWQNGAFYDADLNAGGSADLTEAATSAAVQENVMSDSSESGGAVMRKDLADSGSSGTMTEAVISQQIAYQSLELEGNALSLEGAMSYDADVSDVSENADVGGGTAFDSGTLAASAEDTLPVSAETSSVSAEYSQEDSDSFGPSVGTDRDYGIPETQGPIAGESVEKDADVNENSGEEASLADKDIDNENESSSTGSDRIVKIILSKYSKTELLNMDDNTLLSLIEEAYEDAESKRTANSETDIKSKKYCPGHVDLYVRVNVSRFEDKKGLRSIKISSDPFKDAEDGTSVKGDEATESKGSKDKSTKEKSTSEKEKTVDEEMETEEFESPALKEKVWNGWTEDKISAVNKLISMDWYKAYGFSISTIDPKNPLTQEEISRYLDSLPDDISSNRKKVIKFALESVGKVPYYYGGKASDKGYEGNHFGTVIGQADHRGRIFRGLDCSGWIHWVYWTAIGDNLHGSCSTSTLVGEGEKIKRADLQPGDIIIREGADSHVVMFLQWVGNGNMIAIHENGSANNVSVNEVTASYPYYRKLIN